VVEPIARPAVPRDGQGLTTPDQGGDLLAIRQLADREASRASRTDRWLTRHHVESANFTYGLVKIRLASRPDR